jgi:hypothetical protein
MKNVSIGRPSSVLRLTLLLSTATVRRAVILLAIATNAHWRY